MPRHWNFLSNYGLVISYIAQHPDTTLREIARVTDLTERAVYQIVRDLESEGFVLKEKTGRRNSYALVVEKILRFPAYGNVTMENLAGGLLRLPTGEERPASG